MRRYLALVPLLAFLTAFAGCASDLGSQVTSANSMSVGSEPVTSTVATETPGTTVAISTGSFCDSFKDAKDASDSEMLHMATTVSSIVQAGGSLPTRNPRGAIQMRTELARKLAQISPPELRADFETLHANRLRNQQRIESGKLDTPMVEDGDEAVTRIISWLDTHCHIKVTRYEF